MSGRQKSVTPSGEGPDAGDPRIGPRQSRRDTDRAARAGTRCCCPPASHSAPPKRSQKVTVFAEKRGPVHDPLGCRVRHRSTHDLCSVLLCLQKPPRPIRRHQHVIFDDRHRVGTRSGKPRARRSGIDVPAGAAKTRTRGNRSPICRRSPSPQRSATSTSISTSCSLASSASRQPDRSCQRSPTAPRPTADMDAPVGPSRQEPVRVMPERASSRRATRADVRNHERFQPAKPAD